MNEILTCPFCNMKSEVDSSEVFYKYVQCNSCGASSDVYPTRVEAIEAWNARHYLNVIGMMIKEINPKPGTKPFIDRDIDLGKLRALKELKERLSK